MIGGGSTVARLGSRRDKADENTRTYSCEYRVVVVNVTENYNTFFLLSELLYSCGTFNGGIAYLAHV